MALKPAQLYTTELKSNFWEIAYEKHYMFANYGWHNNYNPSDDNFNEHEFVSVSTSNEILGYIKYSVDQRSGIVSGLFVLSFSKSIIFGRDLFKAVDDIFCKYQYTKLKYGVFIGNPIEKTYDRLTKKYGGRVIGISKKEAKLLDGNYYDHKSYELFREDYIAHKHALERRQSDGQKEITIQA